jgi:hypothetical protein
MPYLTRVLGTNPAIIGKVNMFLEQEGDDKEVVVYPNPVKDDLNISLGRFSDESFSITVYNTLGQHVFGLSNIREGNAVNMSHLQSGTYMVVFSNEKRTIYKTIIKE